MTWGKEPPIGDTSSLVVIHSNVAISACRRFETAKTSPRSRSLVKCRHGKRVYKLLLRPFAPPTTADASGHRVILRQHVYNVGQVVQRRSYRLSEISWPKGPPSMLNRCVSPLQDYSSDIAPSELKEFSAGKRFSNEDEVKESVEKWLSEAERPTPLTRLASIQFKKTVGIPSTSPGTQSPPPKHSLDLRTRRRFIFEQQSPGPPSETTARMSFPKAKIHRFNDEQSKCPPLISLQFPETGPIVAWNTVEGCAPPPGTYDPKPLSKVKGVVMDKEERFKHPLPSTPLDLGSSVESIDSVSSSSARIFRTPQATVSRKKLVTPRGTKGGEGQGTGNPLSTPSESSNEGSNAQIHSEPRFKKKLHFTFKSDSERKLIDQIDELARVHSLQLLKKNQEISSLHEEIDRMRERIREMETRGNANLSAESEKDLDSLKEELEHHRILLVNETGNVESLKAKSMDLENNLENALAIARKLEQELEASRRTLTEVEAKCYSLEVKLQESLRQHKLEVSEMSSESAITSVGSEEDMQQRLGSFIEEATERMVTLGAIVMESQAAVARLLQEVDRRCSDLEQALTVCCHWNEDLLKDYEAIAEEYGVQRTSNLEKSIKMVDVEEELSEVKTRCRNYSIVHAEATKTVEVLSKRLFESETDVERLNVSQKDLKTKCARLEQRVRTLLEEDRAMRENLEEMKDTLVGDVLRIEHQLLAKVDAYNRIAHEEIERMKANLQEKVSEVERCRLEADERVAAERALYLALKAEYDAVRACLESQSGMVKGLTEELEVSRGMLGHALGEYDNLRVMYTNQVDKTELLQRELEETRLLLGQSTREEELKRAEDLQQELEDTRGQLEIKSKEILAITSRLGDMEAERDFMLQERSKLTNLLEAANAQKHSLEEAKVTFECDLEKRNREVTELESKIQDAEHERDILLEEKLRLERLLAEAEGENHRIEELAIAKRRSLEEAKVAVECDLATAKALLEERCGEVTELESKVQDAESARDLLLEEKLRLEKLLAEAEGENHKLEEEAVVLKGDLEKVKMTFECDLAEVNASLEKRCREIAVLESRVQEAECERDALLEEKLRLEILLAEAESKNHRLNEETEAQKLSLEEARVTFECDLAVVNASLEESCKEVTELKSRIQDAECERDALLEEKLRVEKLLAEAEGENHRLEEEVIVQKASLEEVKVNFECNLAEMNSSLEKKCKEATELETRVQDVVRERDVLLEEKVRLENLLRESESESHRLEEEGIIEKHGLEGAKQAIEYDLAMADALLDKRCREFTELESRVHDAECARDVLLEETLRLENLLAEAEAKNLRLQDIGQALENNIEMVKSQLEMRVEEIRGLELRYEEAASEKECLILRLNDAELCSKEAVRTLEENELKRAALEQSLAHLDGEVEWLYSYVGKKDQEIEALETRARGLEVEKSEVEHQFQEAERKNDVLKNKLESVESEFRKMKIELESRLKCLEEENGYLLVDKCSLEQRVEDTSKELVEITERLLEAEFGCRSKDEVLEQNNSLSARVNSLESELSDLKGEIKKKEKEISEKEEEMKVVVQTAVEAQDDLAALREQTKAEGVKERARRKELQAKLDEKEKALEIMQIDIASLKEINKTILADLDTNKSCTGYVIRPEVVEEGVIDQGRLLEKSQAHRREGIRMQVCESKSVWECAAVLELRSTLDQCNREKEYLERQLAALSEEHGKLLGHQNNKQKIHHIGNMMKTTFQLRKEVDKLRAENLKLKQKGGKCTTLRTTVCKQEDQHETADKENPRVPQSVLAHPISGTNPWTEPTKRPERDTIAALKERN
ncbi:hypothetical protein AAG570_005720 [Ranatra chinensis]|uniref:Hyaluronan-mediated motility receptor C-terminal domain-containing protein n=1 Tax=Ranatra chinensis TaxID=642074 RepID=A0ABD0YLT3_9HEMI